MSNFTNEKVWYKKNKESNSERAEFITQKGHNTAIIEKKGNSVLARADKIGPQGEYEKQNKEEISTMVTAQCGIDLDLPKKEIRERDKESKAILKMRQLQEVQDLFRS